MPLVATRGAASVQGFGEFAQSAAPNYIEQVFQTWLYTGNGSTQTITNGIDLSTKGGLVWFKSRSGTYGTQSHVLTSNELTNWTKYLSSNTTGGTAGLGATAFTPSATGFALNSAFAGINDSGTTYASWTFRKQPKFFDVVTYTGTGSSRTVAHSLGSVPGCIIVKRTDVLDNWQVYHRSLSFSGGTAQQSRIVLNTTAVVAEATLGYWDGTAPTSTVFSLGGDNSVNASGGTYVAYLFAHDAGGFGLTGTDNVISCGSYTGNGSATGPVVTLGYEPQWMLIKASSATSNWYVIDNMRGMPVGGDENRLFANDSSAEAASTVLSPTATGFQLDTAGTPNSSGVTYIYIAIRRGPMKTPTSGTSVYESTTSPASGSPGFTAGFPVDFAWLKRPAFTGSNFWGSRLTGAAYLDTTDTAAEQASGNWTWDYQSGWFATGLGSTYRSWMMRRAPGFFDVVCYTGTGSATTVTHNLGVAPELMITKRRDVTGSWRVFSANLASPQNTYLTLNVTDAAATASGIWPSVSSTTFGLNAYDNNNNGGTFVAYLFASCPGVSKVGSYTGTGATQTINCGFTGGARFVLIKRTDSTGDWYVWDTARGMVSGTDPSLLLNSSAAEVNANSVYTTSVGFQIVSTAAGINASGGSYIFLAIA